MAKPKLIQTFSVVVDVNYNVATIPASGLEAKVLGSNISLGGGYSSMIAASRLGMHVAYAGILGTGPFSELARSSMSSDGIQQLAKGQCDRGDIGVCSVIVEPNGERTFYKHHGVERNGFLDQNSISSLVECDGDFILASGYTFELTKQRESALSAWRNLSKQAITIFDPSPVHNRLEQQYLNEILACSSWVSLSENEALEITRRTSTAEASISLADHGPNVVVRSGARGAFVALANSKKAECIPTISVVAVDTTAAGETHIGVMAHALSRGATVPSAVRLANIAAALSTTRHGASTGPHLEALYAAISAVPGVDQTLGKLLR